MSRYGAFVLSVVAATCVMKSKKKYAEYFLFLDLIMQTFKHDALAIQLYDASKAANELFGLLDTDEDVVKFKEILGFRLEGSQVELEQVEVSMELNNSLTSESSQSTLWGTPASSPLPSFSQTRSFAIRNALSQEAMTPNSRKQHCMLRIKRKIICKRRL